MAQVTDPVCGMVIDSDTAAGQSLFRDRTYYFCSQQCLQRFEREPACYVTALEAAESEPRVELEHHEPPYTKTGWIIAPKFGAAGSGGAEYERLPESHKDHDAH